MEKLLFVSKRDEGVFCGKKIGDILTRFLCVEPSCIRSLLTNLLLSLSPAISVNSLT